MLGNIINNRTLELLEKGLDGASMRQKAIANNLANVDTPGYKAIEVTFEDQLREAWQGGRVGARLRTSHPRHFQIGCSNAELKPQITMATGWTFRNDKNNVDVDREMARLAKNSIYYNSVAQSMNNEFRLLRMAITEGRK